MLDGIRWFPGAAGLVGQARAEMPQKDGFSAAFVVTVALRTNGFSVRDQDEAALAAGVRLGGIGTRPPEEKPRDDYRVSLPHAETPGEAGASAAGIARAVQTLSEGRLCVVPASGDWRPPALAALLSRLYELGSVAPVANVDTAEFGAFDTPGRALLDYLEGGLPPMWWSRWRAPHFTLLGGVREGVGGTIVSVVDSYPSLGDKGVHLQLLTRLAAALRRERLGRPGGLLLVVPEDERAAAAELVRSSGLRTSLWD